MVPARQGRRQDEDTKTEDPSHLSGLYGLYHLQNPGNGAAPHSAYVYEGNKDDKGTKGGKGSKEDPKKLIPLVAGAFDQAGSGAARNLPVYLDGTTTLAVLTNSVRSAMGLGYSPRSSRRRSGATGSAWSRRGGGEAQRQRGRGVGHSSDATMHVHQAVRRRLRTSRHLRCWMRPGGAGRPRSGGSGRGGARPVDGATAPPSPT
jgi:hypothetical protein